jgi:hypothetical protein
MKLAALYSVYNGLELLEKSIEQIYDHVFFVIICYQTTSNVGEVDLSVAEKLFPLHKNKVFLMKFEPDLSLSTKQNERNKHNLMLRAAKLAECTHFFMSACDHFYDTNEFLKAKKRCEKYNLDTTYTKMFTYYKNPTWQITPIEDYYMPFICKLYPHTEFVSNKKSPLLVDPSLILNSNSTCIVLDLMMHHYSMIRTDIQSKFNNAAAGVRWTKEQRERFLTEYENYTLEENKGIEYFKSRKVIEVPNYFGL